VDGVAKIVSVEHPRGFYTARVDDKGRLKLPADFHRYLTEIGAVKVFVTSFDERIGRIYPTSVWREIEGQLQAGGTGAPGGKYLLFTANDLGGDAEVDAQGRLLLPAELRKALKVENDQVRLQFYRGGIQFFSNAVYEQEKQASIQNRSDALKACEDLGLL
jgi:MraZ protein